MFYDKLFQVEFNAKQSYHWKLSARIFHTYIINCLQVLWLGINMISWFHDFFYILFFGRFLKFDPTVRWGGYSHRSPGVWPTTPRQQTRSSHEKAYAKNRPQWGLILKDFFILFKQHNTITPSNSEIICIQNVGAKLEMVSYLKK